MRVLFYLLDGETNASSWHRALQYFPLLRAHGIDPVASRPVPEGLYQRFVERQPRRRAAAKAAFYSLFLAQRALDVARAASFDVVVIQRDLFPFGPPLLERSLARRNAHLVYDTDDATYVRPSFTPHTPFQRWRRFDKIEQVVSQARWVSAATEPIAEWARRFNPSVSVVPMAVDLAVYDRVRDQTAHREGHRLVIGWAGTAGGLRYLHALAPVLRDLATRFSFTMRVISGGYRDVCLPGVQVEAMPWRGLREMASFDIGLVPLDDTPFEQAKFPFKLLQYLALGIPAVCARVGLAASVIDDGETGLLASTPAEWHCALERLLSDAALRRNLGEAGRHAVAERYTLEQVGPLLVNGLYRAAD